MHACIHIMFAWVYVCKCVGVDICVCARIYSKAENFIWRHIGCRRIIRLMRLQHSNIDMITSYIWLLESRYIYVFFTSAGSLCSVCVQSNVMTSLYVSISNRNINSYDKICVFASMCNVCVDGWMSAYISVSVSVCGYVCIYISLYVRLNMCACICVSASVCPRGSRFVCVCICMCLYQHVWTMCAGFVWFVCFLFNGISTFVGYLTPKPFS